MQLSQRLERILNQLRGAFSLETFYWLVSHAPSGYPSEQIVKLSLRHQCQENLTKSRAGLLLVKFIVEKIGSSRIQ